VAMGNLTSWNYRQLADSISEQHFSESR